MNLFFRIIKYLIFEILETIYIIFFSIGFLYLTVTIEADIIYKILILLSYSCVVIFCHLKIVKKYTKKREKENSLETRKNRTGRSRNRGNL